MQLLVIVATVMLALIEWYITYHTTINKWLLRLFVIILAIPVGLTSGGHLIALPLIYILLVIIFESLGYQMRKERKQQSTSDFLRSKIKDL
ncbi:hypothetical protein [Streptococcus moroccensis]|uniref:Uncharacterized protein n=1 Tax=Streptococcus moroccensis TaxID=1451356 RepID=A0ABT9YT49_9STRE|nr:hypothetical protein [Streptococcus moroccensis]MDQ0223150.1 hypothetical protein [Streptococcus moroccensis]